MKVKETMWKRLACDVIEHVLWRACMGACALRRGENNKSMRSCCITKQLIWEDCFWGFEEEYSLRMAESAEKMTCYMLSDSQRIQRDVLLCHFQNRPKTCQP